MHREQEAYLLPNEKREVVLYDQFCGDNSILKFEIRLKKHKYVIFDFILCKFLVRRLQYFLRNKKETGQKTGF